MLLTDSRLKAANPPLTNPSGKIRSTSIDLHVGTIITKSRSREEQLITTGAYPLQPQEMVYVTSREVLNVPEGATGIGSLKNSFTKSGVFTVNTGIIDPGWNGPIATLLINFGSSPELVEIDEPFYRVLFFEHDHPSAVDKRQIGPQEYARDLHKVFASRFPKNFLNLENHGRELQSRLENSLIPRAAYWTSVIVLLGAGLAIAAGVFENIAANFELRARIGQLETALAQSGLAVPAAKLGEE